MSSRVTIRSLRKMSLKWEQGEHKNEQVTSVKDYVLKVQKTKDGWVWFIIIDKNSSFIIRSTRAYNRDTTAKAVATTRFKESIIF